MTSSLSSSHHPSSSSPCGVTIRLATCEDIGHIAEVLTYSFHHFNTLVSWLYPLIKMGIAEDLRDRLYQNHPHYCCLIAYIPASGNEKEQIVGTIELSLKTTYGWLKNQKSPYISNLAVKKTFRRQGIGSKLLQKCEQIATDWGFDHLSLHVLAENLTGQSVYLHNGYNIKQVETDLYSLFIKNKRRLLLEKTLDHSAESITQFENDRPIDLL